MRNLLKYIRSKLRLLLFLIVCAVCFCTVFSLYDMEIEAVLYALALCVFAGMLFAAYGITKQKRKLNQIKTITQSADFDAYIIPRADTETEEAYAELAKTVIEKERDLRTVFDRKSDEMSEYYALWAHQIKTPISAIRLLLQTESDGISQSLNTELSTELTKIEQYVEMALGYIETDSPETDFVFTECNLDDMIKQAVRKYAKQFIRKKLTLNYEPVNTKVLTDEKWLVFIISQILSNSLKYTQEGSISIYLQDEKTLVISDTGMGIAVEDLPRVFDKGFTGYNGRTDKKSTGIGLYLCRRIANRLGHELSISSDIGKGTSVYVSLDRIELEAE